MRGPQSTRSEPKSLALRYQRAFPKPNRPPTPPHRPELRHRARVSCPRLLFAQVGLGPVAWAGGGLRQVRAGVGPGVGWGGSRAGRGREWRGGAGRGSLGPGPLPAGAQEERGFLGGLGKVGPRWSLSGNRWSLPGKLPYGCQAPRAEWVAAAAGPPPSAASSPAQRGDAQGSRQRESVRSPDSGLSVENLVVAGGEAKVAPHSPGSVRSVSRGGLTLEGSGKR